MAQRALASVQAVADAAALLVSRVHVYCIGPLRGARVSPSRLFRSVILLFHSIVNGLSPSLPVMCRWHGHHGIVAESLATLNEHLSRAAGLICDDNRQLYK